MRSAFASGGPRERDTAIRDVATELGYRRAGKNIRHRLHHALRVAVRRGVIWNDGGLLRMDCRTIDDFPADLLRDSMLTVVGRAWMEREEAITSTARYLGFGRTGARIRDTLKRTIRSLLRRGRLEGDRSHIRKTLSQ